MEEEDLVIIFEIPMAKADGFIGYLRKQIPNYVIFVTDFTGNNVTGDDMFSDYDKTKPQICVAIRECDYLKKNCSIDITHNEDTVKVVESMGFQDEDKAKLYQVRERD